MIKYFCRDESGKELFFFILKDYQQLPTLQYTTSLDLNLHFIGGVDEIIEQICSRNQHTDKRELLVDELFDRIRQYPGIEKYYFPDYTLDKNGKFIEEYKKIEYDILSQSNFKDYAAFSNFDNMFHFLAFKSCFYELRATNKLTLVDKNHFLELLPHNYTLQELYVKFHNEGEQFYYLSIEDAEGNWDIYSMTMDEELVFFFTRRTP